MIGCVSLHILTAWMDRAKASALASRSYRSAACGSGLKFSRDSPAAARIAVKEQFDRLQCASSRPDDERPTVNAFPDYA